RLGELRTRHAGLGAARRRDPAVMPWAAVIRATRPPLPPAGAGSCRPRRTGPISEGGRQTGDGAM
ncbi:MAG TPA: hypothetical protein VE175_11535, partial [Woeseiaceae bacterium]|nr:hypothetical protein [Woeseiaceae bacterium]